MGRVGYGEHPLDPRREGQAAQVQACPRAHRRSLYFSNLSLLVDLMIIEHGKPMN